PLRRTFAALEVAREFAKASFTAGRNPAELKGRVFMIVRSIAASLLAGLLTAPLIARAAPAMSEAGAVRALATSSDIAALEQACRTLAPALWVTVPIKTSPMPSAQSDLAFRALSQFLTSQRNPNARITCLRSFQHLDGTVIDPQKGVKSASPYAIGASKVIRQMLRVDASPAVRIAAADTLWGSTLPDDGLALLQSAE